MFSQKAVGKNLFHQKYQSLLYFNWQKEVTYVIA
jgi:hypothetical protein